MTDVFTDKRAELQTVFPLPDLAMTIRKLQEQKLAMPTSEQGRFRVRLNLSLETTATLEDYISSLVVGADAFVMFSGPPLVEKQVLTWLQAEPLSTLQSLWPKYLDVFGRFGAHIRGEFPQIQAELLAAAGILTWQGGPIEEFLATGQAGKLPDCLSQFNYVNWLAQTYTEAGIHVTREVRGLRMPTLVPPGLLVALIVLEAKLVRASGVNSINVAYAPCGHLLQDVAALTVLADIAHDDLPATVVCLPWSGGSLLGVRSTSTAAAWTALTAAIGDAHHAEVIMVDKDRALEPEKITKLLELASGVGALASDQKTAIMAAASQEQELIREEADSIINRVLELGQGQVAMGLERALTDGSLDIPLAAVGLCRGQVLSARDATGAIRFLDSGNLPLSKEIKEWHRQQLAERAYAEGRQLGVSMAIDDIYAFSKGTLVGHK